MKFKLIFFRQCLECFEAWTENTTSNNSFARSPHMKCWSNHWHNILLTNNLLLNSAWAVIQRHQSDKFYFCKEETRCSYFVMFTIWKQKYFTKLTILYVHGSSIEFLVELAIFEMYFARFQKRLQYQIKRKREKKGTTTTYWMNKECTLYSAHENVFKIYCPKVLLLP